MTDDKKADLWSLFALFLLFLNVFQFAFPAGCLP
jgi:cbb3-type cytochrome oxidase subunit 3